MSEVFHFPERAPAPVETLDARLDGILAVLTLYCRTTVTKEAFLAALLQQEA